jgi:GNAT superfamily N-acetyltransferase
LCYRNYLRREDALPSLSSGSDTEEAHVWKLSPYRGRGIARAMMGALESRLEGQHIYLFSDTAAGFYEGLGFKEQPTGLSKVIGQWLRNDA